MRFFSLAAGIGILIAGCQTQDLGGTSGFLCAMDGGQCGVSADCCTGICGGGICGGAGGAGGGEMGGAGAGEMGGAGGVGGAGGPVAQIGPGNGVTCVVVLDGRVKCWGENADSKLGLDLGVTFLGDEPGEMGANLPSVDLGAGQTAPSPSRRARATRACS